MTAPVLLAVVEVPHDERVRCSAEGCGHSVFRRVHLVRTDGATNVFGSDCFARLFGSTPTGQAAPRYGGGTGRILTAEERSLLIENTARLIERFEQEHQAEIAEAERRRLLVESRSHSQVPAPLLHQPRALPRVALALPLIPTPAQRAEAESQARRTLEQKFPGVNLDLPGFKGLVRMEVERLLRTHAA